MSVPIAIEYRADTGRSREALSARAFADPGLQIPLGFVGAAGTLPDITQATTSGQGVRDVG